MGNEKKEEIYEFILNSQFLSLEQEDQNRLKYRPITVKPVRMWERTFNAPYQASWLNAQHKQKVEELNVETVDFEGEE